MTAVARRPWRRASDRPVLRSERSLWWTMAAAFFLMAAAWALTVPLFGAPDEPSHSIKAAAVADGQLTGRSVPGESGLLLIVRVPAIFASSLKIFDCYTWHLHTTPACAPAFAGSRQATDVATASGKYGPLYYAMAGAPLRLWPSAFGEYLARLVTAAACAAFLASAVLSARRLVRSPLVGAGVAMAVTPMVIFLNGSVNPNALEDGAALCVWCTALVLLREGRPVERRLLARFCVASAVLVNVRPFSPLWYALAVAAVVALAGWRPAFDLLRDRSAQVGAAIVAAAGLFAVGWVLGPGRVRGPKPPATGGDVVREAVARGDTLVQQMIGRFGWLDIAGPSGLYVLWLLALGVLVLGALVVGRRRDRMVTGGLLAAVVVLPMVLEVWQARAVGGAWQGRYTLPLAVGLPVIAGTTLARDLPAAEARRLARAVLGVFVAGHVMAYAWVARHYAIGSSGPLDYLLHARWHPPISLLLQLVVLVAATTAAAWLLWSATVGDGRAEPADEDGEVAPSPQVVAEPA